MNVYQSIGAVSQAMGAQGISKNRTNTQGAGYKFRGIDDVLNALSSALVAAGLVILPRCTERVVEERATKAGGAMFNVTCRVEFDLVSTEDGSKHTVCTYGEAMDSADKATNKAMSAAYKYLALLVFCIPTEATADNDADFSTHETSAAAKGEPSPKDRAALLIAGVKRGDAAGAAAAIASWEQPLIDAVWPHLDSDTTQAIDAHWPEIKA